MEQDNELDLIQYWEVIRKRWAIIVILPLVAALTSGAISFFVMKPVYEASTTLIVGKKASDSAQTNSQLLDYNVLLANQQLAKTYAAIAKSRTVEDTVIQQLNLNQSFAQLDQNVTVDAVKNTEILAISVDNNNPEMAARIANALAGEFSRAVIDIKKVDSVSVVDKAVVPDKPVKPKKTLNILIAFVVGLMAAVGIAFLLEYLDNTIKNANDVEKTLGLPVLGLIPDYEIDR